jgi:hypothetical protein
MGLASWESIQGPLVGCEAQLPISFGGKGLFIYGGLCPIYFYRELGLVVSYLCSRFRIFNKFVLEEY